jgi:flagellar biosynthesis component FlhA
LAVKNIQQILTKQSTVNKEYKHNVNTTKQIKQKLKQQKATIAEADKGRTMVIIYKRDLEEKVNTFIKDNNITELKTDPTQKFQRMTQNTIKQCTSVIKSGKRKYVTQMNPQAPKLKAKIKMHKAEAPIRPVLSSTYAPTHKIARYINQSIKESLNLKYEYNIRNTMQFAESISKMKLGPEHKLLTMDIKDLYVKLQ